MLVDVNLSLQCYQNILTIYELFVTKNSTAVNS